MSGLVGLVAAAWQSASAQFVEPVAFTLYWLAVGVLALTVGCGEIVWHYVVHASHTERRRSRCVVSQFLPSLVAGLVITVALVRVDAALAGVLPGLWAILFGVGVFAARPYLPTASALVACYYWAAGILLVWRADSLASLSPWTVGGTFGLGQLVAAVVLYVSLERVPRAVGADARVSDSEEDAGWDHESQG